MAEYSSILLEKAVDELSKLPGIGKKTALRLALHLLGEEKVTTESLAQSLLSMRNNIVLCKRCYNISDEEHCSICSNPKRDNELLCVVADMRDVMAIERTGSFNGIYHVLGGVIDPINGISPNDLRIKELVDRSINENFKEIILALPATIEGDTTNYYIFKMLKHFEGQITAIAKGISVGDALEFADEVTLGRSIKNRIPFNH
ncbi:MAG: recombination protein RecR [Bacteroidales bacterium]|jgi:recombination protein RecR|nr:recombination protein RecR [Bacteroidales bacterium]MBQ3843588.1 recombination protein RecR [Bacteroidales bacterium]